jgi:rubrerythrin
MKEMTKSNLTASFAGESQAHMRYLAFADMAEREGLANIARLFRAASYAEQVHATAHLRALDGVGNTARNLDAAFGGESFEIAEMYPAYLAVADLQAEKRALRSMNNALAAEKVHADLYCRAQEAVAQGKDLEMPEVYICDSCGYTMEGEAPDRCPICGAPKSRFSQF